MISAMKRCTLIVISLVALARPAGALPSQRDPWIELRTASFTIFSNADERKTRSFGEDLERLRDALDQISPGLALSSPVPTYVFIFRDTVSFRPYQKDYKGEPLEAGGYFLSRPLASYLVISADPAGEPRPVLYHEFIHHVMRNNYANLPLWLHEGIAEYYSTFKVGPDEVRIGLPVPEHLAWLRRHNLIPLTTLFAVDESSPEYNESSRRGGFYAESWALVHYLISGNPDRRRQALEYLRLAQAGASPDRLLSQGLTAEPAGLERELRSYVQRYLFDSTRIPLQGKANLAMEVRPMAWPDVFYRLGDLLANLDRREAAAEYFRAALAARADHEPSLTGLGQLEERAGNREASRAYYEKAARLAPDDFLAQYLYAQDQLEDPGPDSLRQARAALERVVKLRPDLGEAWASLGYSYQSEDRLPPEAVQALENAHRLLPNRMDVAHNLAITYARTGQPAKAEELIERVLVPAGDAEKVESAREALLDEVQRRAEELIVDDKVEEALPLLEEVRTKTSRPDRRQAMASRIEEIRGAVNFNTFVDRYNQALELASRGDVRGAAAILEPLMATTTDPQQIERARSLLDRLKPPKKKGKASGDG
jgi:tetratricopeptide (TPR) repeat protein